MIRPLVDDVEEILKAVRTQPLHVYWHGLPDQRRRLFAHPEEAIALVVPLLSDPEPHVRRYFARLIRDLDRRRAAGLLEPLLFDVDDEVRLEAAGAVVWEPAMEPERKANPDRPRPVLADDTRERFVAALLPLLGSRKLWVVEETAHLFERSRSIEHIPALVARLPEHDWNKRNTIFGALAKSSDAVALLSRLLVHPDAETRSSACIHLSYLETPLSADLVRAFVALLDDPNENVRASATIAVGRHGIAEAEVKLLAMTAERGVLRALGLLRSEAGFSLALPHVKPNDPELGDAIDAVVRFGSRPATEAALLDVLANDPEPHSMKRAAQALVELGAVRAIPALEQFLKKGARKLSKRSRKEVFRTLPDAIEGLKKLAQPNATRDQAGH